MFRYADNRMDYAGMDFHVGDISKTFCFLLTPCLCGGAETCVSLCAKPLCSAPGSARY